ncbi:MAG: RAMP superfamily CRISPR-associated protein [Thermoproteota archaeon]
MKFPFDAIRTKIIGVLEFKTKSPIHIGIGGEEVIRDLIRTPREELVIPSSTWRGAFRNLSEQIAKQTRYKGIAELAVRLYSEEAGRGYRGDGFKKYVEDFVKTLQGEKSNIIPDEAGEMRSLLMKLGYTPEEIEEVRGKGVGAEKELLETMAEEYLALHCPIGRLYGNRVIAGKVRFFDSLISVNPEVRAGIGIDRKSGKVEEKHLYFIKVIPRMGIRLKIIADNLLRGEEDSKLFASTLKLIKTLGISIGARKSAGLGSLEVDDGKFYVLDVEEDGRNTSLKIGNPLKKVAPISLDEFLKWLST